MQDMVYLEHQVQEYYRSRWHSLEQQARLEYSLEDVSRIEADLVSRFAQSVQLAFTRGHSQGSSRATVLQTNLDQSRSRVQLSCLRNELAHQELQEMRTRCDELETELTQPQAQSSTGQHYPAGRTNYTEQPGGTHP
eukprot:5372310-Amphidinium_carterae.1